MAGIGAGRAGVTGAKAEGKAQYERAVDRRGRWSVVLVCLVQAQRAAAGGARSRSGFISAQLGEATALLQQFVAERKIAGAVAAVARQGTARVLRNRRCAGPRDRKRRCLTASVFRIYSMTRPITAVAAMMLHEEGKFRLDDPIAKYLPEFRRRPWWSRPRARAARACDHRRGPACCTPRASTIASPSSIAARRFAHAPSRCRS